MQLKNVGRGCKTNVFELSWHTPNFKIKGFFYCGVVSFLTYQTQPVLGSIDFDSTLVQTQAN